MKVYVTKYDLSSGISVKAAVLAGDHCIRVEKARAYYPDVCFEGNDWHKTPEAALARAEEMRLARIASLAKQKAKLEALKFTIPEK